MSDEQNDNVEFIQAGEKSKTEKQRTKDNVDTSGYTPAQQMAKQMADALDEKRNDAFDNIDLSGITMPEDNSGDVLKEGLVKEDLVDIEALSTQFDDIMEQSTKQGAELSSKITINDLGGDTSQLLLDGFKNLKSLSTSRTPTERLINFVPMPVKMRNTLEKTLNVAQTEIKRNQTVKQYAENHFDELDKQRVQVNENRESVDQIRLKIVESTQLLKGMMGQAQLSLKQVQDNSLGKGKEIKSKSLMISMNNQIEKQEGILEQANLFENLAGIVSDEITATLPQIKDNFINQVSITAALKNLGALHESIDKTKEMVARLEIGALKDSNRMHDLYTKNGAEQGEKYKALKKETEIQRALLRKKSDNFEKNKQKEIEAEFSKLGKAQLDK